MDIYIYEIRNMNFIYIVLNYNQMIINNVREIYDEHINQIK